MKPAQHATALRFQELIGPSFAVLEFEASTRSAADAAAAIGCSVDQIAKSILFRAEASDRCVLVVAPGSSMIDPDKVGDLLGEKLARPDGKFVKERTGFAIGGVPPLLGGSDVVTFVAAELAQHDLLWAAAGTPNAVFSLTYAQLVTMTGATIGDVLAHSPSP